MIAILPAAGLGTRMAALTGGSAKELLPVAGRPTLKWAIDEALGAGAEVAIVVSSPAKRDLDSYVSELGPRVSLAHQANPKGLADAVFRGVRAGSAALVSLPDTIFHPASPCRRLIDRLAAGADAAVAVQVVGAHEARQYGIFEVAVGSDLATLAIEKPSPEQTSSRLAVAARYALSAGVVDLLIERIETHPSETDMMSLFSAAIARGMAVATVPLLAGERRLDCGDPEHYRATLEALGN